MPLIHDVIKITKIGVLCLSQVRYSAQKRRSGDCAGGFVAINFAEAAMGVVYALMVVCGYIML